MIWWNHVFGPKIITMSLKFLSEQSSSFFENLEVRNVSSHIYIELLAHR